MKNIIGIISLTILVEGCESIKSIDASIDNKQVCITKMASELELNDTYIPPLEHYSEEDKRTVSEMVAKQGFNERVMRCIGESSKRSQELALQVCENLDCGQFHEHGCQRIVFEHFFPGIGSSEIYEKALISCNL